MKDERERMVGEIKGKYGFSSSRVLSVMLRIPRHEFVSGKNQKYAYDDGPVAIGFGQTMSQPYTVAMMTDLLINQKSKIPTSLKLRGASKTQNSKLQLKNRNLKKVLEIGTGSGYQAAVLSKFFGRVYTMEIIPQLADIARKTLDKLGYKNISVITGSGQWGWKEKAPFDAILITAGIEKVPDELFSQLKIGGVLVVPVGKGNDKVMTRYTKIKGQRSKVKRQKTKIPSNQDTKLLKEEQFGIFRFVPFIEEKN